MTQSIQNGIEPKQNNNIACRVFKEQINLINQLPLNERMTVLYLSINNSFNQIDNQTDCQNDNQNESAYVSVSDSVSLYDSLSELSKSILNLLSKNIIAKEFSNNYGGARKGSGAKHTKKLKEVPEKPVKTDNINKLQEFRDWDLTKDKNLKEWVVNKIKENPGLDKLKSIKYLKNQKEAVILHCESKGKTYTNYQAAMKGFIRRDLGC